MPFSYFYCVIWCSIQHSNSRVTTSNNKPWIQTCVVTYAFSFFYCVIWYPLQHWNQRLTTLNNKPWIQTCMISYAFSFFIVSSDILCNTQTQEWQNQVINLELRHAWWPMSLVWYPLQHSNPRVTTSNFQPWVQTCMMTYAF